MLTVKLPNPCPIVAMDFGETVWPIGCLWLHFLLAAVAGIDEGGGDPPGSLKSADCPGSVGVSFSVPILLSESQASAMDVANND